MDDTKPYLTMGDGQHATITMTLTQWREVQGFLESRSVGLVNGYNGAILLAEELADWDLTDPEQTCGHAWGFWPKPCPTCAAARSGQVV